MMNTPIADTEEYLSFDAAAQILGVKPQSVRVMVMRRRLHSFPVPGNGKRRRLLRSEVEARARSQRASPTDSEELTEREPLLSDVERAALFGLAGGALTVAAILLLAKSNDATLRAMAISVLAGLALIVILEQFKSGEIDELERARLERLVTTVQEQGECIDELEQIIQRNAEAALKAS